MSTNDISELISDRGPHQNQFNSVEAATVHGVNGGEISVVVLAFSHELVYATVPFIKKTSGDPASGDPAALHSDSEGNPIYAVVLA